MQDDIFTSKDKEAQAIVQFCFDHSLEFFDDRRRNLERFEGLRTRGEERQKKYNHEYISTVSAEMIEQKAAFTTEATVNSNGKMFDISTYNNIELARDAKAASELLNYYISNMPLSELGYMIHKNLFLFGTTVIEVLHKRITRKEPVQEGKFKVTLDNDGLFGAINASQYKDVDDLKQPFIRQVRLKDFWPDPHPVDGTINTCRWIVKRELLTKKSVLRNKVKYGLRNLDRAFNAPIPCRTDKEIYSLNCNGLRKRDADYDIDTIVSRNGKNEATKSDPIVEVISIYRPGTVQFMVNGVIVSDEIVIYPGIIYPFVVIRNQPMEGEFFGRPDLELIKNNIEFYEEMVNLIHDKYLMNLKPVLFADSSVIDTVQSEKYKKAEAGEIIAVDGFSSEIIKEFIQTPPDPSTINFAASFLSEAKKALAINPMMEGENPGSGIRTEGSLEMFQRIGSTRMQTQLNIIAKGWEEVGKLMLRMAHIFADQDLYLTVTGPLGDTVGGWINPKDININTKFRVKLGAIADPRRDTKVAQMLKYIDVAAKYDQLGLFRLEQALAETAEHIEDFHDPINLWENDPEALLARRELAAMTAGKQQPSSYTGFPSMAEQQAQQPPQQEPQGQEEMMPQGAQASDLPTANEGVAV